MKFTISASLLSLAAVQVAARPTIEAAEAVEAQDGIQVEIPKMIKAKYRSEAKRAIIRYPAFTLAPNGQGNTMTSMDKGGQAGVLNAGAGMCSKCTLLSAHYRLVFPDGREATPKDGVYIHHMTSSLSPKKADNPIGTSIAMGPGAYFIDRGEDSGETDTVFTSVGDEKFLSGYHVNGSPSIRVSYDLVNVGKESKAKQLHLELEYEYLDGIQGKDAGHTLKSVMGTPKLNGKTVSQGMKVSKDTDIVWARGHLHQGGVQMNLNVDGVQKCVSKPTYDAAGVITTMSLCPEVIQIKAGQVLTIESVYDTQAHKLRESSDGSGKVAKGKIGGSDVMGMFAMSYTT
ncbi:ATP synthase subunit beta [Venturia nashicola]|nr:ATP synthase subunit beta [Venturia nashicola]